MMKAEIVVSDLKIIPLGDAVTQMKTGSTPSTTHPEYFGGDILWFTPGDIGSSKNLTGSTRTITQDAVSFGKAKLFEKGMLLVTCIGDIGRVGILQQTASSNQQITALKFNDDIDADFAYYWFISNKQKLVDQANQAVVPILNNERLSEINFAYPPLTEQKRIASLLARADRLRQLRRTAHHLGDALLQSVFLEIFGDPLQNPKNWKRIRLENCCDQVVDCMHTTPDWTNSGVLCVRTSNLTNTGGWDWSDTRYVTEDEYKERTVRSEVNVGDIILSREGTVGVVAIVLPGMKICLGQRLVQVSPKRKVMTSEFLLWLLLYELSPERIEKVMTGSTSQHLNLADLRKMEIIVPPLSLQEEFAGVVARVESLRGRMGESERQVEGLFEALLAEAFA